MLWYINEIIRVTYKCNWKCKFCNVLKTNNFWDKDVTGEEVVSQILSIKSKYSQSELEKILLTFSWGEPLLDKNIFKYIALAKKLGFGKVQIQTNWTMLYKKLNFIDELIQVWLDEIFIAQHSHDELVNKQLGSFYKTDDFSKWVDYVKQHNLREKIFLDMNIVVSKINLPILKDYLSYLNEIWIFDIIWDSSSTKKISIWFIQPNWYAWLNKDEVLLKFDEEQQWYVKSFVEFAESKNIFLDFHFVSPPLCVLNYPKYNLEYQRLKQLSLDNNSWETLEWNLDSYKVLWKEKQKFDECNSCQFNNYCLWFYKKWIEYVWEDYVKQFITKFKN